MYLALRSERDREPVLIWPQPVATARSAIVASSVSPERSSASFAKLYYPVVRHTVWLHNDRKQAPLANAMYRVELRFAELAGHDSGIALLTKNLACGP